MKKLIFLCAFFIIFSSLFILGDMGGCTKHYYYLDSDNDGYGTDSEVRYQCNRPENYVENSLDCNDNDPMIYTGAFEICDGKNNDCNEQTIEFCHVLNPGKYFSSDPKIKYFGNWDYDTEDGLKFTSDFGDIASFKFIGDIISVEVARDILSGRMDVCIDNVCQEKDNYLVGFEYKTYTFNVPGNFEHNFYLINKEDGADLAILSFEIKSSAPVCSDGQITGTEECDDGNTLNNDGCSSSCQVESGYDCSGSPSVCISSCIPECSIVGSYVCSGVIRKKCVTDGTGCKKLVDDICPVNQYCTVESGNVICKNFCGNGVINSEETCDDGNTVNNDGCSSACYVENGYDCSGTPSVCQLLCVDQCTLINSYICELGVRKQCIDQNNDGCLEFVTTPCPASQYCAVEGGSVICKNYCGNGVTDTSIGEICDGKPANCVNANGYNGQKQCGLDCKSYGPCQSSEFCGDITTNGIEICDTESRSCVLNGFSGLQKCKLDCTGFGECISSQSCGNGKVEGNEACDDGNKVNGDGCSALCLVEIGWICDSSGCKRKTCEMEGKCGAYPYCVSKKIFYSDLDGDGFGDTKSPKEECALTSGFSDNNLDCDDENRFNYPGNKELCDGLDNNCNGARDDFIELPLCHTKDSRFTAFGVCSTIKAECKDGRLICTLPVNYVSDETEFFCDDKDNDCDGETDEKCSCDTGKKKDCGISVGECKIGKQECKNDGTWGICTGDIKPVKEICDGKDNDCDGETDEDAAELCTSEGCNGYKRCVDGVLSECFFECEDSVNVNMQLEPYHIRSMMDDAGLEGEERRLAAKTIEQVKQNTDSRYETGKTKVKSTIETNKLLNDMDYTLYIPKCLAPYIGQIKFDNTNYTIIKDDPIIAWHFAEVKDRIDLSYEIEGRIPEQCLDKIKGLPVAKLIGETKKGFDLKSLFLPFILIMLAVIVTVIPKHLPGLKKTEADYEKDFIEKQREKYIKQVKSLKFNSRQQAEHYLVGLGLGEEDKEIILDKLFR